MSTSNNLYFNSEITGYQVTETRLLLNSADGRRFSIPLGMLGYFQEPYAPDEEAELLVLRTPPKVQEVAVTEERLSIHLEDGRILSVPLAWFPRLRYGTAEERQAVEIWGDDWLHWEALDEDISVTELFKMTGPSAETDESIRRWRASRENEALQSAET